MPTGFLTALLLVVFGAILLLASVVAHYQRAPYTRYLLLGGVISILVGSVLLQIEPFFG